MEATSAVKTSLKGWATVLRLPFNTVVVLPFILGAILAYKATESFDWPVFLSAFVAVVCLLEMTFLLNEYWDFETDCLNREFNKFTGGSRALPEAMVDRRAVRKVGYWFLLPAAVIGIGLVIYFERSPAVILFGLFGIAAGYFYTAPPVQLAYRGWGEIIIGVSCGWLPLFVGYYLIAGRQGSGLEHYAGIPIGTAAFLLILINEIPDYASDKASRKKNLVVRIGRERSAVLYGAGLVLIIVSLIWLGISFFSLPGSLAVSLPILVALMNLAGIVKGDWKRPERLEGICGRTIILSLLVTSALIAAALI